MVRFSDESSTEGKPGGVDWLDRFSVPSHPWDQTARYRFQRMSRAGWNGKVAADSRCLFVL